MRLVPIALACALLSGGATFALAGAPHASAAPEVIPRLTGNLTAGNADRVLAAILRREDRLIGIKLNVDTSTPESFKKNGYLVAVSNGQFSVSKLRDDENGAGMEVVTAAMNATWEHGGYVVDGIFLVKGGGIHQGVRSVGLEKVNEAEVLLSPKVRVVAKPVS